MKISFNFIILITLLVGAGTCLSGQKNKRENQFEGYIILADSSKKEVAIEVEDINQPWTFQEGIKYFDKSLLKEVRVRREDKKSCVAGEVIEYGFGDRRFVYVDYYVKADVEENKLKTAFGKFKGEKNTDYFAEIIRKGKISMLKFYVPPTIEDDDYDSDETMKKHTEKSKTSFDILVSRDGHSPKSIETINFKEFFSDCEYILKKYKDERYKIKPAKGLKVILGDDRLYGIKLENAAKAILDDYDSKCSK